MENRELTILSLEEKDFPTFHADLSRDPRCDILRARFILRRRLQKRKRRVRRTSSKTEF